MFKVFHVELFNALQGAVQIKIYFFITFFPVQKMFTDYMNLPIVLPKW